VDADRRQGSTLRFEPAEGVLVVGARTAVLDAAPAPDVVVGRYVELVFSQRAVQPHSHQDLRNRELVELAALLDLPPAELDALIDHELERLLGHIVGPTVGKTRAWRRLVFAAMLGTAAAAGVVWALSADADVSASTNGADDAADSGQESPTPAPPVTDATVPAAETPAAEAPVAPAAETPAPPAADPAPADGSTVETVDLPGGGTATRTESPPAPPSEGVDIGTAVVYERNGPPPAP